MVWFDEGELRRRAGNKWYGRALTYVNAVDNLRRSRTALTATVRGTDRYKVRLSDDHGELGGKCSCPLGREGNFCKHCVAVGLAALASAPSATLELAPRAPAPEAQAKAEVEDIADLRVRLDGLEKAALVDLLVEVATRDPAVRRLLSLRNRAEDFDPAALEPVVDGLKRSWRLGDVALARLSRAAAEALSLLDRFAADHPAAIRPLYQRALQHLTAPSFGGQPDDKITTISEAVTRAVNGVIAAYRAEPPDPVEFVRWLIDVEIKKVRFPEVSVGQFAEILGEAGLASYWRRLSDLADSAARSESDGVWSRRSAIFQLRESYLVKIAKDVDRLVDLYAEDLSQPGRYLRIGEALRDAERFDEAITWLQRGLARSPSGERTGSAIFLSRCTPRLGARRRRRGPDSTTSATIPTSTTTGC